jgi:hypothetical protein
VKSLKDLGNKQLETIRDGIRYEATKRGVKRGQAKAKKLTNFLEPSLPAAKELLEMMLSHPVVEERGLTEILVDSPNGPLHTSFIPNTTAAGGAPSLKKALFRPAIAELFRLGWLLPPEQDDAVRIYELNPEAHK